MHTVFFEEGDHFAELANAKPVNRVHLSGKLRLGFIQEARCNKLGHSARRAAAAKVSGYTPLPAIMAMGSGTGMRGCQ